MVDLYKIAQRSTHKRHMTGAMLTQGTATVSYGWSHVGNWRVRELYSVHAEIHAIIRARQQGYKSLPDGVCHVLTIARKSGNVTSSLPCLSCAVALIDFGVELVKCANPVAGIMPDEVNLPDVLDTLKVYPVPGP